MACTATRGTHSSSLPRVRENLHQYSVWRYTSCEAIGRTIVESEAT